MLIKDTLIIPLSDMHSGGATALFPPHFWQGKHNNHTPTKSQKAMFQHFDKCAEYVRKNRKNKRVVVVHNGDAIDGVHHGTLEVVTYSQNEQLDIHVELMEYFLDKIGFDRRKGDQLYYTEGTESHVRDDEDRLAKFLPVQLSDEGLLVHPELMLNINGRKVLFLHHGPTRGRGVNRGNPLRLWMGSLFWTNLLKGYDQPDLVITGHTHTPAYNTYVQDWKVIHGVICPSWQMKTRYANGKAPAETNEIGLIVLEIKADGEIKVPVPLIAETNVLKVKVI